MTMRGIELVCLAIVTTYVVARLFLPVAPQDLGSLGAADRPQRLSFATRFVVLAVASFAGEDTVIRAYGYYSYATGWSVRLDHVPLVIVLVWPVVIDSAATLARAIIGTTRGTGVSRCNERRRTVALRVATLGAAIVLADASLIEPIAVRAGLWRWTEPGLFGVPLIGIVGWAFFAWAAIFVFEALRTVRAAKLAVVTLAPIATHALILSTWWALFRWVQGDCSGVGASGLAWGAAVVIASIVARHGLAAPARGLTTVPIAELLLRLPGALFFFVLLGLTAHAPRAFAAPDLRTYAAPDASFYALVAYALAFAPPYLTALVLRAGVARSRAMA
jgi:hypothetical protein